MKPEWVDGRDCCEKQVYGEVSVPVNVLSIDVR